ASPCEKFRRATSMPARMSCSIFSGLELAGPRVATIFVRRMLMRLLFCVDRPRACLMSRSTWLSGPMIRVACHDSPGSVQLFSQYHAHHGVRQCQRGKSQFAVAGLLEGWIQSVGSPHNKYYIASFPSPFFQLGGQTHGADVLAAFVERD